MRALLIVLLSACSLQEASAEGSQYAQVVPTEVCIAIGGEEDCPDDMRCNYGPHGGFCCHGAFCCTWGPGDSEPVCSDAQPPCPDCG